MDPGRDQQGNLKMSISVEMETQHSKASEIKGALGGRAFIVASTCDRMGRDCNLELEKEENQPKVDSNPAHI